MHTHALIYWYFRLLQCYNPLTLTPSQVYMQPSLLGWRPVVASWMATLPDTITQKHK